MTKICQRISVSFCLAEKTVRMVKMGCLGLNMQILLILSSLFVPKFYSIPSWGGQNLAPFLSYINILIVWVWILNIQIPIFLGYISIFGGQISIFLGKISIFWGKLTVFWSQILSLFGIKILISGVNSGVTPDKKVSREYIWCFDLLSHKSQNTFLIQDLIS